MIKKYLNILLLLTFWSCGAPTLESEKTAVPKIETKLTFLPEFITAGQKIIIHADLKTKEYNDQIFSLHLNNTLGTKSYQATAIDGKIAFEIPGTDNHLACKTWVKLIYGEHLILRDHFNILPQNASDKIDSYNGPKTLFAQDKDGSMNVVIPHDKFGNPLIPKTLVQYSSNFEGNGKKIKNVAVDHLVAYDITPSRKEEGKYLVGANAFESYTREQEIIIEATMPSRINLKLIKHYPYSDSRQFVHIKSDVIRDQFGNVVTDGTLINFVVFSNGELLSKYHSFTIGGSASVFIENPSSEQSWNVLASLYGSVISNEIAISFKRNVQDFELSFDKEKNLILIGPTFGDLKQLVPDGTEVIIELPNQKLKNYVFLENGKTKFEIPFSWDLNREKSIEVTIGGLLKTIVLND